MDGVGSPIFEIVVTLFLTGFIMVIFGFAASLDALSHNLLEKLSAENSRTSKIMNLMDKKLFRTGMKYFYLFLVMILELLYVYSCQNLPNIEILVAASNLFLLIFGIYIPQKAAASRPECWAYRFCVINELLYKLSFPFLWILDILTSFIVSIFGIDVQNKTDDVTEEEIISMVREGHEQGVILASEAEMIHNIFEFSDKEAKDIMTRRRQILALNGEDTFESGLSQMIKSNYSRFPVFKGDIDNIIGVIHIKEALYYSRSHELGQCLLTEIKGLVSKTEFVPETRNINSLFRTMQNKKIHMAVVIDEYGQTSGIITMEDIIEEIVGNILDEHDVEEPDMVRESKGVYLIHGMADFMEIARELKLTEIGEEYDTLNGYLIAKINKIPADDERMMITADGYQFQILEVDNKVIQKVRATKLNGEPVSILDKSLSE